MLDRFARRRFGYGENKVLLISAVRGFSVRVARLIYSQRSVSYMSSGFAVLKFTQAQYVDSFLQGHLHMKPLEYFANLEGDALRSDRNEGADFARQILSLEIRDERGDFVPVGGIINPIVHRSKSPSGVNVFCMHALSLPGGFPIDRRNFAFGHSYIVLTDGQAFVDRVRRANLPRGKTLDCGLVQYVERATYDGPLGPFRKFAEFSYQKEFRLTVSGGDGSDFEVGIGDISDICVVGPASEINERLRVNPAANGFEIRHEA